MSISKVIGNIAIIAFVVLQACKSNPYGPVRMQVPKMIEATYVGHEYVSPPLGLLILTSLMGSNSYHGSTYYYYQYSINGKLMKYAADAVSIYNIVGEKCWFVYDSINPSSRVLLQYSKFFNSSDSSHITKGIVNKKDYVKRTQHGYLYYSFQLADTTFVGQYLIENDSGLYNSIQVDDTMEIRYLASNPRRNILNIAQPIQSQYSPVSIKHPVISIATYLGKYYRNESCYLYGYVVNGTSYYKNIGTGSYSPFLKEKCQIVYDSLNPERCVIDPNNRIILEEDLPRKTEAYIEYKSDYYFDPHTSWIRYRYIVDYKIYRGYWHYNNSKHTYKAGDLIEILYSKVSPRRNSVVN